MMTFDPTTLPTGIDLLHLILAASALLFIVLYLFKGGAGTSTSPEPSRRQAEERENPARSPDKHAPQIKSVPPDSALQLLSLLQQEARFIDFLQEDLSGFSDADIGAVARVVHGGGKKILDDYFILSPVRNEQEESRIDLPEGFDATEIRLTGNVVGQPPFSGTLIHRGWKVGSVKLPRLAQGHDPRILAPAEVEL